MLNVWYIYTLSDPETHAVRYVGKTSHTLTKRLQSHKSEALRKRADGTWYARYYRVNWLRSIYLRGLIPVIQVVESGSGDWQSAERRWIAHYRQSGADLINTTDGGEGAVGVKHSPETVRQRSFAAKAQWAALSESEKQQEVARLHTPEVRALRAHRIAEYWQKPEAHAKAAKYRKEAIANNPEALAAAKAALHRGVKRLWSDPDMREKAVARLRAQAKRGAASPHAKLTEEAVQDIRRIARTPYKGMVMALARKYSVDKKLINLVIRRKIWVDTPDLP